MPSPGMLRARTDFDIRISEMKNYFDFLSELEIGNTKLLFTASSTLNTNDSRTWIKTLRASGFLLIYNLIESTMRNAVEAIFSDMALRAIPFDDCRFEIRKIIVNNFKAMAPDKAVEKLAILALDVVVKTFNKERVFSGNIDAQKIREVARKYGFTKPSGKSDILRDIKTHRNDLAHGDKTFDAVGRDYTANDLSTIFSDVQEYLLSALENIEEYIDTQAYLKQLGA